MTLTELRKKDVIQLQSGANLGRADDLRFDGATARIEGLVLFGRAKLLGLLGRRPELFIPWADIVRLGQDAVLVKTELPADFAARESLWQKLFGA